jgi:Icc-related predicted phosphoesterase
MQIQLLSALHVDHRSERGDEDFYDWLHPGPGATPDLLVIAGDLVELRERQRAQRALDELSRRWTDILWVPGNHEFYGLNPVHVPEVLSDIGVPSNVEMVFEPRAVQFKTQRFLCGTMWYSRKEVEETGCVNPKTGTWIHHGRLVEFSDFRHVRHLHPWVYHQNEAFTALLQAELGPEDVVVTHHLPSAASTPPRFQGEISNCFFVSDHEGLIGDRQPRLWLHGHTHSSMDYRIGRTRVLANPVGYPRERRDFLPLSAIVDV